MRQTVKSCGNRYYTVVAIEQPHGKDVMGPGAVLWRLNVGKLVSQGKGLMWDSNTFVNVF